MSGKKPGRQGGPSPAAPWKVGNEAKGSSARTSYGCSRHARAKGDCREVGGRAAAELGRDPTVSTATVTALRTQA